MLEIVGNHILGSFSSVASDIVPLSNFDTEPKRGPATVAIPEKVHLFYKKNGRIFIRWSRPVFRVWAYLVQPDDLLADFPSNPVMAFYNI